MMTRPQLAPDPIYASTKTPRLDELDFRKAARDPEIPWATEGRSRRILGMRVDSTTYSEAVDAITHRAGGTGSGTQNAGFFREG